MGDKEVDPPQANANGSATQQTPDPPLPPVVEGNEDSEGQNNQHQSDEVQPDEKKTLEAKVHWTRYVEASCACLLVLITLWYAGAAQRQAKASETAAVAARDAVRVAEATLSYSAINNGIQTYETNNARQAAEATAKTSLQATIDEFRLEQRAWVMATTIDLAPAVGGQRLVGQVQLTNLGKTPAFNLTIRNGWMQTSYVPLNTRTFGSNPGKPLTVPTLGPGDNVKVPQKTDQVLTDLQVGQIGTKTLLVYVFGDIEYHDAFGRKQTGRFCGKYDPPTRRFDICQDDN